jgi:hypothetical protein
LLTLIDGFAFYLIPHNLHLEDEVVDDDPLESVGCHVNYVHCKLSIPMALTFILLRTLNKQEYADHLSEDEKVQAD